MANRRRSLDMALAMVIAGILAACGRDEPLLTFSGSAVGREGEVVRRQLERFRAAQSRPSRSSFAPRPTRRPAPSALRPVAQCARRRARRAAARRGLDGGVRGRRLDCRARRFQPPVDEFFASAVAANRWNGALYALPWFVDVGMLYWRTDLMPAPPQTSTSSWQRRSDARARHGLPFGFVWQGARYEGLVTVFLEHLGAFGGAILDGGGRVVVDSEPAVRALTFMRDAIHARRASCRRPCSRGRRSRRASRSRTARRPSCATGRMRSRSWTTRNRPSPAASPWRRCRAGLAARRPRRSAGRRWPSTRSAISPTMPIA